MPNAPDPEIVWLGASSAKDGSVRWQAFVPVAENDNADIQSWGECPVYQALGVTSQPAPADENGHAEGALLPNISGRRGVLVGGRDTRDAAFLGKLEPGDTVLHSTGSNKAAQFRAHNKKRSAAVIVRDVDGNDQVFLLDGKNKQLQIFANGAAIQIDKEGDITLKNGGGAALLLQGDDFVISGNLKIPGLNPGMYLYQAPITGPVSAAPGSPVVGGMPVNGVGRAG